MLGIFWFWRDWGLGLRELVELELRKVCFYVFYSKFFLLKEIIWIVKGISELFFLVIRCILVLVDWLVVGFGWEV